MTFEGNAAANSHFTAFEQSGWFLIVEIISCKNSALISPTKSARDLHCSIWNIHMKIDCFPVVWQSIKLGLGKLPEIASLHRQTSFRACSGTCWSSTTCSHARCYYCCRYYCCCSHFYHYYSCQNWQSWLLDV